MKPCRARASQAVVACCSAWAGRPLKTSRNLRCRAEPARVGHASAGGSVRRLPGGLESLHGCDEASWVLQRSSRKNPTKPAASLALTTQRAPVALQLAQVQFLVAERKIADPQAPQLGRGAAQLCGVDTKAGDLLRGAAALVLGAGDAPRLGRAPKLAAQQGQRKLCV